MTNTQYCSIVHILVADASTIVPCIMEKYYREKIHTPNSEATRCVS